MQSEQQQGSASNGADSAANIAMSANGGVDQKWRRNYVPYQEAADATA